MVLGWDVEETGVAGSHVAERGGTGWGSQADGDMGGLSVGSLVPPLAGHWEELGKEQGPEWMRGVGGLVTERDHGGVMRWW